MGYTGPTGSSEPSPVGRLARGLAIALGIAMATGACVIREANPAPPPPPPPGPGGSQTSPQDDPGVEGANGVAIAGDAGGPITDPNGGVGSVGGPPAPADPVIVVSDVHAAIVNKWGGHLQLIPFQTWPVVKGRAIGLLMASGQQPWGGSINWGRGLEHGSKRTEYRFLFDHSSPYAVYFVSDGRGFNFMKNWSVPVPGGGNLRHAGVAMFRPDTPNSYGLARKAHLVEVEVNGGRGGQGLHFVITGARVVDGTETYPLRAEETLISLRQRFDDTLLGYQERTTEMLRKARSSLAKTWMVPKRGQVKIAVWPTWVEAEGVLEVLFVARMVEVAQGPVTKRMRDCPRCVCTPDGKCPPCMRCDPTPIEERPSRQHGFEMAAKYRVDRSGRLSGETIYAPRAL